MESAERFSICPELSMARNRQRNSNTDFIFTFLGMIILSIILALSKVIKIYS